MNKVIIAVYGSLRKGEYNFREGMDYLGTLRLKRFSLIDLKVGYPAAVGEFGITPPPAITVDIMQVDYDTFLGLASMEAGAGYRMITTTVNMDGQEIDAFMWVMHGSTLEAYPNRTVVESGDWSEYLKTKKTPA